MSESEKSSGTEASTIQSGDQGATNPVAAWVNSSCKYTPESPPVATRTSPNSIIFGGTSSSYQDLIDQKKTFDANQRRAESDRKFAATREMPEYARMHSRSLQGQAYVILEVKMKDGSTLDWLVCDVSTIPQPSGAVELLLVIPCPVCVLKNRKLVADSMMQLRQSNRGFTLDPKGEGEMWVNPKDPSEVYLQAGTVSTHEAFRCDNGCRTRYQIDRNVIRVV